MRRPTINPLYAGVAGALLYEVVGDLLSTWLQDNAAAPVATFIASPWSTILVLILVFAVLWVIQQRTTPIPPGIESALAQVGPATSPGPQVGVPTIVQESTEAVLRRKWEEAERRAADSEARLVEERRARGEVRERSDLLHRATDILITWLYRRENWHGLTAEGQSAESAPWDIWAKQKYDQLGLNGVSYQPPDSVAGEPGFLPPSAGPNHSTDEDRRTNQPSEGGVSLVGSVSHQVIPGPRSSTMFQVAFETAGRRHEAHKLAAGRPISIRFTKPDDRIVRPDELPVVIPCGQGRLVIERFYADGVVVDEDGTAGDPVSFLAYYPDEK